MRDLYTDYVMESYDSAGKLTGYKLKYNDSFNFGYDVVDRIAEEDPRSLAMVWCDPTGDELRFTFADMKIMSDKTANYLKSLGIGRGDKVLCVLKRNYEFWYVSVALHKLGAVLVPATFMLTAKDVEYRINACSAKAVICTADCTARRAVDEAEHNCPSLEAKMLVRGTSEGWLDFGLGVAKAEARFERVETAVTDPMLLYFSSGTSGYPKMVMHDFSYPLAHIFTARHWHRVVKGGLHLSIADTGWGKAAWGKIYGQWIMRCAVMVYDYDKFSSCELLSLVGKYGVTTLCCPPTMFRMFLADPDVASYDLSSLTCCSTAGEPLSPDTFERWRDLTGMSLMEGFGQTETTLVLCNIAGMAQKPGSIGCPSPQYRVALLDEDGHPVAPGKSGEICVDISRGRPVGLMSEYYRDSEKTSVACRGGYYHTGDIARMDEDGYFWYEGRNDDIIKSSGYRIGPFEVESVMAGHPAVAEVAVTGEPHPARGQVVKATVVLNRGYEPSEELKAELQAFVKANTAPYKYPRIVTFAKHLPKTVNGKVRRVELRRAAQG